MSLRTGVHIIVSTDNWSNIEFQRRCNVVFKMESHPAFWDSRSQTTFELSPRIWRQLLHTVETAWLCVVQLRDAVVILTGSSDCCYHRAELPSHDNTISQQVSKEEITFLWNKARQDKRGFKRQRINISWKHAFTCNIRFLWHEELIEGGLW